MYFNNYAIMKKRTLSSFLLLLIMSLGILLTSCKKKTDDPEPEGNNPDSQNGPKGRLYIHLHNYFETTEVDAYNIVYTTSEGRKIELRMGQVYLSNIQLIKLDGSVYTVPDVIVLSQQGIESYPIADVPAGNYKTIRFNIGLDPAANGKTPSTSTADPLNRSEMWYGSTAQPEGFVFVNAQGRIDTTADASGSEAQMQPFSYRIGTNAHLKQKTMPDKNFTIVPDQAQYCHMYMDYTKLFAGIQINKASQLTVNSPTDNASELAAKIANNLPSMFFYEE